MTKEEFEEKWRGVVQTNADWLKYKYEIWNDIENLTLKTKDNKEKEKE